MGTPLFARPGQPIIGSVTLTSNKRQSYDVKLKVSFLLYQLEFTNHVISRFPFYEINLCFRSRYPPNPDKVLVKLTCSDFGTNQRIKPVPVPQMHLAGSSETITNVLDLKNPYFRYTGSVPVPPGNQTTSPSDNYWENVTTTATRQCFI